MDATTYTSNMATMVFEKMDFDSRMLRNIDMRKCRFIDCSFEGTELDNCNFSYSTFNRCKFNYATMRNCNLSQAFFVDCDLGKDFAVEDPDRLHFENCRIDNTRMTATCLSGVRMDAEMIGIEIVYNTIEIDGRRVLVEPWETL